MGSPGKSLKSRTYLISIPSPAFPAMLFWLICSTSTTPDPIVPYPITAAFIIISSNPNCSTHFFHFISQSKWRCNLFFTISATFCSLCCKISCHCGYCGATIVFFSCTCLCFYLPVTAFCEKRSG